MWQSIFLVTKGGYLALQDRVDEISRYDWCNGYLTTLVQKDMTDLAKIENLCSVPNILKALANRAGSLLNERDLARTGDMPLTTVRRYVQLLQHLFLVSFLPGW